MTPTLDRFRGCLLGLATGDALGAPHEGGPLERLLWRVIGRTRAGRMRWTDDTQMSWDLAESLLVEGGVRPDALAKRFAANYRWSRGYGPGVARVLKRIRRGQPWEDAATSVHANGSYGNGAAMRAPVLALFLANTPDDLVAAARATAAITHAHPLGIEGAIMIAVATHAMLTDRPAAAVVDTVRSACVTPELTDRIGTLACWLEKGEHVGPREVAQRLGNGMSAATSCPTAVYVALRHVRTPFEQMMRFIVECRGDVDTIGAMAGALWGAANGAAHLPDVFLEAREELDNVAARLHSRL